MKIFYNNSEVSNNMISYDDIYNKPFINSSELSGNLSLDDLNLYNKFEVDKIINESSKQIKILLTMPSASEIEANTLYYIGPNSNGKYNLYLVNNTNIVHDLGLNEIPAYSGGDAIRVDDSNTISLNYDDESFELVSNSLTPKLATLDSPGIVKLNNTFNLDNNYLTINQFKSGTSVGSNSKPIYLNNGSFTVSNGNIGSDINNPIYMNNGNITAFTTKLVSLLYPVGTIYMSTTLNTAAKVASALGGTWVAWGTGRTLVGVNTSDTDFNTVEKTGGEKAHQLTIDEMPSHKHEFRFYATAGSESEYYVINNTEVKYTTSDYMVEAVGNNEAHNNLQPYITCYMWKKTAL